MSTSVVIDASVWVSNVISQESHHEASRIWLKSFIAAGGSLVVPAFILIEVAAAVSRVTGSHNASRGIFNGQTYFKEEDE